MMKTDWEIKKLEDVCEFFDSRRKPISANKRTKGQIPYYGATGILDYVADFLFDEELILLGEDGAKWGPGDKSAFRISGKTWVNNHAHVLKPKNMNYDWIIYYLNYSNLMKFVKGATVPKLNQENARNIPIPVPPLEEQKRIVKILDEKFAQLETIKANAQTNLQNAKDLFQSQLTKAFSNTIWEKKRLDEVCELISGYAFDSKGYTTNDNDTLLICGDNIMHCSFRWETVKRWPKEQYSELKRFELQDSDIVLAMDRPWIKSGLKISQITKNELPSLLVQRTAALRASNKMISDYLYYALQVEGFSKYLIEQQTGVGVPHISGKQILNYEIPLPPLPEQKRIVKELDTLSEKVRQLQEIYTKQIANCDELKQSLLQKAFEGEL